MSWLVVILLLLNGVKSDCVELLPLLTSFVSVVEEFGTVQ